MTVIRELRDSTKYGFGVGRTKVLETRLLSKSQFERLVEAESLTEQLHILTETDYGQALGDVETSEQVDSALGRYLAGVYDFLEEVCPDSEVVSFFRLKHDFHNLKLLLKAKYRGKTSKDIWSSSSRLDQEEMSQIAEEDNWVKVPPLYRDALLEAVKIYEDTEDIQKIDVVLDKKYYREASQIAFRKKNPYLQKLVEGEIDLANFKVLFRSRNLGKDKGFVMSSLIDGGTISKQSLLEAYDKSLTDFILSFNNTPYIEILEKVRYRERDIDLRFFDKLIDNYLVEQIKQAKYISVGVEVIIGYVMAKENEVNILRLVLVGRLNSVSKKAIRDRMRDLYV